MEKAFDLFWPELESSLQAIQSAKSPHRPHRSDREILEEILTLAREQMKRDFSKETAGLSTINDWVNRNATDAHIDPLAFLAGGPSGVTSGGLWPGYVRDRLAGIEKIEPSDLEQIPKPKSSQQGNGEK